VGVKTEMAGCILLLATAGCSGPDTGAPGDTARARTDGVGRQASPADRPGGTGACDKHLAALFGGAGAVAAGSGYEPQGFQGSHLFSNGADRSIAGGPLPNQWGHLFGYAMHLYAAPVGRGRTGLHVPPGFTKYTKPSGGDAVALFYYPALGSQKEVTLAVYHLMEFAVRKDSVNAAGSVQVGILGGPGGNDADYVHSHLEVHRGWGLPNKLSDRNATRVFFYDVFCPTDGAVPAPAPASGLPPGWTCNASYYDETGASAGEAWCDCGCGAPDPDCAAGAQVDGCSEGETCSSAGACVPS